MVEVSTTTLAAAAAAAGVVVVVLFVLVIGAARRSRAAARRLAAVSVRLDLPEAEGMDGEDALTRLERLAQGAMGHADEAVAEACRLRSALDELDTGVVVCDEDGEVAYRNAAARRLRRGGGDAGALVRDALEDVVRRALSGERATRTVEALGPPRLTVRVSARPVDDGRRMVGAVAVLEDVSERRRLDVVRRDFLANVSNELKTPVAALGLVAATVAAEDDPALTRRLASRLAGDAVRVGRVVDDLVELSHLQLAAGGVRDWVPVNLLVAQAVQEARALAANHEIVVDASAAPPALTVVGDRRQLVSAVRRLVENAVRFSPDGAKVHVKTTLEDGEVAVSVRDRGSGVPAGEFDRIFEAFYRVDRGRARDAGGSGLGLAIASAVAASHGGSIGVESKENRGSTFTLRLPAATGAAGARAAG